MHNSMPLLFFMQGIGSIVKLTGHAQELEGQYSWWDLLIQWGLNDALQGTAHWELGTGAAFNPLACTCAVVTRDLHTMAASNMRIVQATAIRLNIQAHELLLSSGEVLKYSNLCIATGAVPKVRLSRAILPSCQAFCVLLVPSGGWWCSCLCLWNCLL
jgi:hypothetical protein